LAGSREGKSNQFAEGGGKTNPVFGQTGPHIFQKGECPAGSRVKACLPPGRNRTASRLGGRTILPPGRVKASDSGPRWISHPTFKPAQTSASRGLRPTHGGRGGGDHPQAIRVGGGRGKRCSTRGMGGAELRPGGIACQGAGGLWGVGGSDLAKWLPPKSGGHGFSGGDSAPRGLAIGLAIRNGIRGGDRRFGSDYAGNSLPGHDKRGSRAASGGNAAG